MGREIRGLLEQKQEMRNRTHKYTQLILDKGAEVIP